jgi:hypothetical protein
MRHLDGTEDKINHTIWGLGTHLQELDYWDRVESRRCEGKRRPIMNSAGRLGEPAIKHEQGQEEYRM